MKKSSLKTRHYFWQIDIRICHTVFIITFFWTFISSKIGEELLIGHIISGMILSVALIYRIIRGIIVIDEHNLITFKFNITQIIANFKSLLNRCSDTSLQKTALGKVMIIALYFLLSCQILTSLFITKIDVYEGLFGYSYISDTISFEEVHEVIGNIIFTLVIFHISANLWYLFYKKTNLIRGMFIDGYRETTKDEEVQIAKKSNSMNKLGLISNHYSIKLIILLTTLLAVFILFFEGLSFLSEF